MTWYCSYTSITNLAGGNVDIVLVTHNIHIYLALFGISGIAMVPMFLPTH